ncbi:hypothetical protein SODALDRAFT_356814 [Sodiomyces alkalinus F11]|uniref:FAD-binding FR-type domain-containing protein n=1 Tax=Sodiomyces alkalinus (strain CBS 110278 / VKM F-3762 / F11) TaxID=1314773 RepID=A0A3N2Q218_SODAK|nr:hypothetical protein SODALDRAFT_356814 [Sodiomyces alkalinus F11]ROT40797.1 hypothetical protein SODALDRAFT_356814 [Sodiomyces alkalinus F11]
MDTTYHVHGLRNAIQSSGLLEEHQNAIITGGGPKRPTDPDQLAYFIRLITAIRDGRRITTTYNIVVLFIITVLALFHLRGKARTLKKRTRQAELEQRRFRRTSRTQTGGDREAEDASLSPLSSSSSSTAVEGTAAPPCATKNDTTNVQIDIERVPLLPSASSPTPPAGRTPSLGNLITAWLMYQPRPPIPLINKTLPPNGTSLFILSFLALNVFYHLYRVPLEPAYFFAFADRAACIFIVNLPLLYLLAAKNQPLKLLTGCSYESLNIFHRRLGELLCAEAAVHSLGMLAFQAWLAPDWLLDGTTWDFLRNRLALLGMGTFVSYELLYLTSLASFRQKWYELFLASHVVLHVAALVLLWFHFSTSRPYVAVSLAIFVLDRIAWRLVIKSTVVVADVTVLPDGDTLLLSADWDLPSSQLPPPSPPPPKGLFGLWSSCARRLGWTHRGVKAGWKPTDHVFLTVPALGRTHALQTHPFTIASAAPVPVQSSDGVSVTHAWFSLLIRAQSGFTTDLLHYAHRHRSVSVRLDGPYGSSHALHTLEAADDVVLVAGGSGIAVAFPLVWALLMDDDAKTARGPIKMAATSHAEDPKAGVPSRRVHLLWIVHSREHQHWIPSAMWDDLVSAGLDLVIPGPTAVEGRPDVGGYVGGWLFDSASRGRDVGVLVSGPDGLNRVVRNTCAGALARGADVRLVVEKFGW